VNIGEKIYVVLVGRHTYIRSGESHGHIASQIDEHRSSYPKSEYHSICLVLVASAPIFDPCVRHE
jgi:hypothetical protein